MEQQLNILNSYRNLMFLSNSFFMYLSRIVL